MHRILFIESACRGLLMVNGQFCGPLEGEGQAFPMGGNLEAYIQFFPYESHVETLAAALEVRGGQIKRLEPADRCFALMWPDGVIQLEIRAECDGQTEKKEEESIVPDTLLRYLTKKIAGDESAQQLLMQGASGIETDAYSAAVPLRFAPDNIPDRYDERAGLVRRVLPNAAVVDAVFASTVPAGQGKRMLGRIEVLPT